VPSIAARATECSDDDNGRIPNSIRLPVYAVKRHVDFG
jgi:hypothetical protein